MIRRVLTSNEASIAPTEWMILERVVICFKSNHSISRPVHLITVVDKDCIRLVAICDYNGLKGVGLCVKEQKYIDDSGKQSFLTHQQQFNNPECSRPEWQSVVIYLQLKAIIFIIYLQILSTYQACTLPRLWYIFPFRHQHPSPSKLVMLLLVDKAINCTQQGWTGIWCMDFV